jgi:integration host factor subunit alpha
MTKAEIVQSLYDRVSGFSKKECADVVELVFSLMKDTLAKGDKIKVSGFGNFLLRDKQERPINISPRRVLTFKASQILRHNLNKGAKNASSKGAADPTASHLGK